MFLATLLSAFMVAVLLVGLDATTAPLVVTAVGFLTTTAGVLLTMVRVEEVRKNVNGHLARLTQAAIDNGADPAGRRATDKIVAATIAGPLEGRPPQDVIDEQAHRHE